MKTPAKATDYYIVVAADTDRNRLAFPSALSVAKACCAAQAWGIGERTQHRTSLCQGDRLLIYIGGVRDTPKSFVAEAAVAAPVRSHPLTIPPKSWPLSLPISHWTWLPRPVPIHTILTSLAFIANPHSKKWGSCLQGGIVKISKADFDTVKRAASKAPVRARTQCTPTPSPASPKR